jgi:hypothetical protein
MLNLFVRPPQLIAGETRDCILYGRSSGAAEQVTIL